jgi:peptidoglycan/xylan/chitin deacetylase (PgdA/CDA1 family)
MIRYINRRFILLFVIMLFTLAANTANLHAAQVHIIIYHTFLGKERIPTDFSIEQLQEHLDFLEGRGFKFVSVSDVLSGRIKGSKNILVTIDDGNKTLYRAYREVLRPRGIKPLLAIYPNIIGRQKYALTWEQLDQLSRDGCDIAAHGFFHLPLKEKLYQKNKQYFHNEIYKSKKVLEERLGRKITLFVYPSGEISERAEKEIRDAGYKYAFTIKWGTLQIPLDKNTNMYELPRYMLEKENWKNIFARLEKKACKGREVKYVKRDMVRK